MYSEQTLSKCSTIGPKVVQKLDTLHLAHKFYPMYVEYISNIKERMEEMEVIKTKERKCRIEKGCPKFTIGYTGGSLPGYHAS